MQKFNKSKTPKARAMYLAPIDAIWPPLLLLALAATVGSLAVWFGIKTFMVLAIVGAAILIGDLFGRSKDYLNARRRFVEARSVDENYEVVRRFRRAWCARVACNAAWKRERHKSDLPADFVKNLYHELGYRWWHIFPDLTFTRHSPFIKTAFWVHLFTGKMKRDTVEQVERVMEPAE